jgi:hypothetical protein
MQWYGWDSRTETWHGPSELHLATLPAKKLLRELRSAPGHSWYGPVTCDAAGGPEGKFFALIHDLSDCAMAQIYCDESKVGPAELLTVIPPWRRARLRPEFAFEFLAYCRFLGSVSAAAEFQLHEAITAALAEAPASEALVLSINSGTWPSDQDYVLSSCIEQVAVAVCQWLPE